MGNDKRRDGQMVDIKSVETSDGVFVVDKTQGIVHWNGSAERILGFKSKEMVGKLCYEIMGGHEEANRLFCRRDCPVIANARRGRVTKDYDLMCAGVNGERKWINVGIMVPTEGEWRGAAIHIFRDVTRRRKIEDFALNAAKALRDLQVGQTDGQIEDQVKPAPTPSLSRRESEVLKLLASGLSTREIASALDVQPVTARNHITRLLNKLGASSRLEAVLYASQREII